MCPNLCPLPLIFVNIKQTINMPIHHWFTAPLSSSVLYCCSALVLHDCIHSCPGHLQETHTLFSPHSRRCSCVGWWWRRWPRGWMGSSCWISLQGSHWGLGGKIHRSKILCCSARGMYVWTLAWFGRRVILGGNGVVNVEIVPENACSLVVSVRCSCYC